jgi:hypothetical protein
MAHQGQERFPRAFLSTPASPLQLVVRLLVLAGVSVTIGVAASLTLESEPHPATATAAAAP